MSLTELYIEDLAYGGAGVGRREGVVYFVPGALPGERVEVEVIRRQKRFCEARVINLLVSSESRISPRCPIFGRCGGCAYQHLDYAEQLVWKRKQVRDLYRRIGEISEPPVFPVAPSPENWGSRNRIRVRVREGRVGLLERGGRRLVEVKECAIASDAVNSELSRLRARPGVDREVTLSERPEIRYFEQTNDGAGEVLCRILEEHWPENVSFLVDAYAGAGFFGRRLAPRVERVIGIELHSAAVRAARERAGEAEQYLEGSVEDLLGGALSQGRMSDTAVLLDPPASGVVKTVLGTLKTYLPRVIIYVSCDAATQARDVRTLVGAGYELQWVRPVDMFPQTADIEVVALLNRQ